MVRMSAKKQNSLAEVVRDAATGYAAVVLSVVCFLLVLVVVMAGVRIISGTNLTGPTVANQAAVIFNNPSENGSA